MQIENPPTERNTPKPEGERRGLVIVHTGDGKGKSTAAFGLALRAFGRHHVHGKQVRIYQFMKVPSARFGEHRAFDLLAEAAARTAPGRAKPPAATTRWTCWPQATGRTPSSWIWPCQASTAGRPCGACA